jgi:putative transcriptional regulator
MSCLSRNLISVVVIASVATVCAAEGIAAAQSQKPFFLVATRTLMDPIFAESVVLMLPPKEPPLVSGVIINKPTTVPVRRVFPQAPQAADLSGTAFYGGPVNLDEPCLTLRSAQPPDKSANLIDDLDLIADADTIGNFLKDPRGVKDLRLYIGRAQWSRPQLRAEIYEGSWYIMPADVGLVFSSDPKHLWSVLVERGDLLKAGAASTQRWSFSRILWFEDKADSLPTEP